MVLVSCVEKKKASHESPEESSIDRENLIAILDTIRRLDRDPFIMRDSISEIHGPESEEAKYYQRIAWKNHPSNIKKVKEILGPENGQILHS